MSQNYAKGLPMGDNQIPIIGTVPAVKAIVTRMSENANTSSVISLGHNTTAVEIGTVGTAALIRWITTSNTDPSVFGNASIMNYDHLVPANSYRRFVVPIEAINNIPASASFVGANREYGLFQRIAWTTQGIASVYMTEYGKNNSY